MSTSITMLSKKEFSYARRQEVYDPYHSNETFEYQNGMCVAHVISYYADLVPFFADPDIEKQPPDYELRLDLENYYREQTLQRVVSNGQIIDRFPIL